MDEFLVLMLFDGPEMLFDRTEIQYQHYYLEVLHTRSKASATSISVMGFIMCTVTVSSWSIANNFVIDFYCRCLEILCQIT